MGDMIVKDNGFTENCSEMGNSLGLFNKQSTTQDEQSDGQAAVKSEQIKTVSNSARKFLVCHDVNEEKNKSSNVHPYYYVPTRRDIPDFTRKHGFEKFREMQGVWGEFKQCVRFVYKNAISPVPCVVLNEELPKGITDALQALVDKLLEVDDQQLFIKLQVLVRDFIFEAKDHLKALKNHTDDIEVLYLRGILASYGAFCLAADNLAPFLPQLNTLLMEKFSVDFQLLNKYLFQTCMYSDLLALNDVPLYISKLKAVNSGPHLSNKDLVNSYLALDDEMTDVSAKWLDVKKMILKLSKKRVLSNYKPLILEDWEIFRENRTIAASRLWIIRKKKDLQEFDIQLMSLLDDITTRICELDLDTLSHAKIYSTCFTCNPTFCCCDECAVKHLLTCVETPPTAPLYELADYGIPFTYSPFYPPMNFRGNGPPGFNNEDSTLEPSLPDDIIPSSPQSAELSVGNNKSQLTVQEKEETNSLFICNNKVNKIPMPKNFLKLITDKVITKSFVKNYEEDSKPDVKHSETASIRSPATTSAASSNVNTATPSIATSKVPVSTSVAISITQTSLVDNHTNTLASDNKQGRSVKEVTKTTQSKLQCNHTYQAANKKTKETSAAAPVTASVPQQCKEGCTEHGPVKSNKESKRCDCPHCEVFENTNVQAPGKNNKTRERLRIRLNEKRNKAMKEKNTKSSPPTNNSSSESTSSSKSKSTDSQPVEPSSPEPSVDTRDIRDLINFIEGTDRTAQLLNAQKKLAKKARRRERKLEEERLKEEERLREEEEKRRLEEERILEEERRLKEEKRKLEEARIREQQAAKNRKNKVQNTGKSKENSKTKNNNNNHGKNGSKAAVVQSSNYLQTSNTDKPASNVGPMVTIKRVMECTNSEPTVTITLKGSTPDKDKLLYTLVNGQTDLGKSVEEITVAPKTELTKKQKKNNKAELQKAAANNAQLSKKERNNKKKELAKAQNQKATQQTQPPRTNTKTESTNVQEVKITSTITAAPSTNSTSSNVNTKSTPSNGETTLNLQMLRLPPGITITKVDGPAVNRKLRLTAKSIPAGASTTQPQPMQSSDNRSGVIVVDTVKLKEVLPVVEQPAPAPAPSKKNKKKKNKNKSENKTNTNGVSEPQQKNAPFTYKISSDVPSAKTNNSIVTIKNPMFYQLHETLNGKMNKAKVPEVVAPKEIRTQQASIIKGANGMVTIRSPRLNGTSVPSCNGHSESIGPIHSVGAPLLPDLKPVIGPNTPVFKPAKSESKKPFNAQEILSGLPGIEITKINKDSNPRSKNECKVFQPADVSIIPTNMANGTNGDVYKLFYDNMDWSLESVFAPKDIKEDEVLDAEELELEAFKRFCQQSVPPERKEKVAHLNVKDIVLKKKTSSNAC